MQKKVKKFAKQTRRKLDKLVPLAVAEAKKLWDRYQSIKDTRVKIIVTILGVAILWMLSGVFKFSGSSQEIELPPQEVKVIQLQSSDGKIYVDATGTIDSNKKIMLQPQISGEVLKIIAKDGTFLKKGSPIIEVNPVGKYAEYESASAALKDAKLKLDAANALFEKGLSSTSHLELAKSKYKAAVAEFERTKENISNIFVSAPYDGYLDKILVQVGDLVSDGFANGKKEVGMFNATNPLIAVAYVSPEVYDSIAEGETGMVTNRLFAREGIVRFKSSVADVISRSYRIEMEVDNSDLGFRIGEVVRIKLPRSDGGNVYKIPKSSVNLGNDGSLVAKTVGEGDKVEEYKIEIVSEDDSSFVVKGLPRDAKLIALGSQYVKTNDKVRPVYAAN